MSAARKAARSICNKVARRVSSNGVCTPSTHAELKRSPEELAEMTFNGIQHMGDMSFKLITCQCHSTLAIELEGSFSDDEQTSGIYRNGERVSDLDGGK